MRRALRRKKYKIFTKKWFDRLFTPRRDFRHNRASVFSHSMNTTFNIYSQNLSPRLREWATTLTEEDFKEYKKAFYQHDRNKDGHIDAKELLSVMRNLGENPTEDELMNMVFEMDVDNNGVIDFEEFMQQMEARKKFDDRAYLTEAFGVFDVDGDGRISTREFREAMEGLGTDITCEEVDEIMRTADQNGDGSIDYEEFVTLILGELEMSE